MTKWVISDLHLGHANILKYSGALRGGTTSEEHDQWIVDQWNSVVKKCDVVYVLGDAAMNLKAYRHFKKMKGQKILVRGNHDINNVRHLIDYFSEIAGLISYRRVFWLSHAPIHPMSLRGRLNIHGHLHQHLVPLPDGTPDTRYINACVEQSYGVPQSLDELYEKHKDTVLPQYQDWLKSRNVDIDKEFKKE